MKKAQEEAALRAMGREIDEIGRVRTCLRCGEQRFRTAALGVGSVPLCVRCQRGVEPQGVLAMLRARRFFG